MVVDDQQSVLAYLQIPSDTAVAGGLIGNPLLADDGETGVDAYAIDTQVAMGKMYRIVIGKLLLVMLEAIASPSVHILLQTDDVRILVKQVVTDLLKSLLLTDIITDEFDGSLRWCRRLEMKRHIYTNRYKRKEIAQDGNPDHAELKDEPEEQEEHVCQQEEGECHPHTGQHGVVGRTQPVGIAYQTHHDDGGDIRPCNHLSREFLQLLNQFS